MQQSESGIRRVLIVGGSIAGTVAAVALKRAGIDAEIYESRPEASEAGGLFVGLAPNGVDVLESLGLAQTALAEGIPCPEMVFRNHRGKVLGRMRSPTILVSRASLISALQGEAVRRGVRIHWGKKLNSLQVAHDSGVKATFSDGSTTIGDALLGCDGIQSATRRSLMPEAPRPVYTGVIGSGAITRGPALAPTDGVMLMTFGRKGFFAYLVAMNGETCWFDNFAEPGEPNRSRLDAIPVESWREKLLNVHAGDHAPIESILRATDTPIARIPLYDMPALPSWHRGPVCLIGDAAHATSPHIGQGTSLAMEDAIEVAKCLRDIPSAEAAFDAFEALRKARVDKLVREARRSGNQKALSNPAARWLRDLLLPLFLKKGLHDAEHVFAHRIRWEERMA